MLRIQITGPKRLPDKHCGIILRRHALGATLYKIGFVIRQAILAKWRGNKRRLFRNHDRRVGTEELVEKQRQKNHAEQANNPSRFYLTALRGFPGHGTLIVL